MYNNTIVPVDLGHTKKLIRALETIVNLSWHYWIKITFVGITSHVPRFFAHLPKNYQAKLGEPAKNQVNRHTIETATHLAISHDPSGDLDTALLKAVGEISADLIVMQSHIPVLAEHLWPSNGGKIARQAKCSVMVVCN